MPKALEVIITIQKITKLCDYWYSNIQYDKRDGIGTWISKSSTTSKKYIQRTNQNCINRNRKQLHKNLSRDGHSHHLLKKPGWCQSSSSWHARQWSHGHQTAQPDVPQRMSGYSGLGIHLVYWRCKIRKRYLTFKKSGVLHAEYWKIDWVETWLTGIEFGSVLLQQIELVLCTEINP